MLLHINKYSNHMYHMCKYYRTLKNLILTKLRSSHRQSLGKLQIKVSQLISYQSYTKYKVIMLS